MQWIGIRVDPFGNILLSKEFGEARSVEEGLKGGIHKTSVTQVVQSSATRFLNKLFAEQH